jgi:hypothetical protein
VLAVARRKREGMSGGTLSWPEVRALGLGSGASVVMGFFC